MFSLLFLPCYTRFKTGHYSNLLTQFAESVVPLTRSKGKDEFLVFITRIGMNYNYERENLAFDPKQPGFHLSCLFR